MSSSTWKKNAAWAANYKVRLTAKAKGEILYFPLYPCRKGHLAFRYIGNNHCTECSKAAKIVYHANTPVEIKRAFRKRHHLKQLYGLSIEQYKIMLKEQNELCKLCNKKEDEISTRSKEVKSLAVDHCKYTGKVRGLLCGKCNKAIGMLDHNPELLRKAALYCE